MLVSSPSQPMLASEAQSRVCRGRTLQMSHMELHPESIRACRSTSSVGEAPDQCKFTGTQHRRCTMQHSCHTWKLPAS